MRSHMLGMRPQTQGRFSVSTHTAWWKEWQSSILVLSQFLSTSLHTISLFTFHLRGYYSIQADLYLFFKHFSRICCQFRPVGKLVNSVGEPHFVRVFGPLIWTFIILVGHTEKLGHSLNVQLVFSFAVLVRAPSHFLPGDESIKVGCDNSSNKSLLTSVLEGTNWWLIRISRLGQRTGDPLASSMGFFKNQNLMFWFRTGHFI